MHIATFLHLIHPYHSIHLCTFSPFNCLCTPCFARHLGAPPVALASLTFTSDAPSFKCTSTRFTTVGERSGMGCKEDQRSGGSRKVQGCIVHRALCIVHCPIPLLYTPYRFTHLTLCFHRYANLFCDRIHYLHNALTPKGTAGVCSNCVPHRVYVQRSCKEDVKKKKIKRFARSLCE